MNSSLKQVGRVAALFGVLLVVAIGASSVFAGSSAIEGSGLALSSVEDSASYYLYHYELVSSSGSTFPVAVAGLRVPDSSAVVQPPRLASTGSYDSVDARDRSLALVAPVETVPLGASTPIGWLAAEMGDGTLSWWDSIAELNGLSGVAPNQSLAGFALRSTHLPGPRPGWTEPAWAACCSQPWGTPDENPERIHPSTFEFGATFVTLGPAIAPGTLDFATLQIQLDDSCNRLGWITNSGICNSLQVKLDAAQASLGAGAFSTAKNQLHAFANELDALNLKKLINRNAYWMLKINAEALAQTLDP